MNVRPSHQEISPYRSSLLFGNFPRLGKLESLLKQASIPGRMPPQAFLGGQSAPHIVRPPGIEPGTLSLKGSCSTD